MYTNADRQKLIAITRKTGNEVLQYLKRGKVVTETMGTKDSVGIARVFVQDCDTSVHTHPHDYITFSARDLLTVFAHGKLCAMEVLCYKTAYRVTIPAAYYKEVGMVDDLFIQEKLSTPECSSLHRFTTQNRIIAITEICAELGWKFERFDY
jgi:hypothetical protein